MRSKWIAMVGRESKGGVPSKGVRETEHKAPSHSGLLYFLEHSKATFEYTEIQVDLYSETLSFRVPMVSNRKQT